MTHFEEDIAISGTYGSNNGITVTVKNANAVILADYAYLKAGSGSGTTTYPVAMVIKGSESGQTMGVRLFQVPASSGAATNLVEVGSGFSLAGMTLHVSYEGT